VFFVISGFLITGLLLDEFTTFGNVSLRRFYIRRSIRIFPAFLAYMTVLIIANQLGWITLKHNDILHALTYTVNFHADRSWYVGHLWSLSVEEQFYLLWPWTIAALGPRKGFWVAAAVLVVSPMARTLQWVLRYHYPELANMETFPTIADALAAGCLLALGRQLLHERDWYLRFTSASAFLLVPALALVLNRYRAYTIGEVFGEALMNLCIALCIDRCVRIPNDRVGRILNWRPIALIGVLSYSLYLWQQLFLNRNSLAVYASFPLNLALAMGVASASYYLLEKPLFRVRKRFSRVHPAIVKVKESVA
jgi:peptidoglycan/LPS O-acetylase OafA/YrhL